MDSQITITLLSSGLQAMLAYWGYKLTVDPIETPQQRRWYRAGFIIIGIAGVALTVTQQWLSGREQAELLAKIDGVGTGVEQVRAQTQQPPSVTVNVPPIQVLTPAPPSGPLPTYPLTGVDFPGAQNDKSWFNLAGHPVPLDWGDLEGIDVYADVEVWAKECGKDGAARARVFDLTSGRASVETEWINPVKGPLASVDFWQCVPIARRLKLPRATGTHVYLLQASSESDVGYATARGQIILKRQ